MNLALVGSGIWMLDIMMRKAQWNTFPMSPLPYVEDARDWLRSQMEKRAIPAEQLSGAGLIVECVVELGKKPDWPFPSANFDFVCTGIVISPDRQYTSVFKAQKVWGLHTV